MQQMVERKRLRAEYNGIVFEIEEDKPEVGAYLYVYKPDEVYDDLQNSIKDCQEIALEDFGVPMNSWKYVDSVFR